MRRRDVLIGATVLATSWAMPAWSQTLTDTDANFDVLLHRYVRISADGVNRVDYARWHAAAADRQALDRVIEAYATLKPSTMARGDAMAYWGNLYNAITLKVILDRYPVASIRDIKSQSDWLDVSGWLDPKSWTGPWRQQRVTVEGRRLSLDDIEHVIMRPTFKDPRVHYMVNCASIGCPNLMPKAWRAVTLEADLVAAARAFINHPRGATFLANGTLKVSSIYRWFIADFGGSDSGVIAHLAQYATPDLLRQLATVNRIGEDAYDWTLNRVAVSGTGG